MFTIKTFSVKFLPSICGSTTETYLHGQGGSTQFQSSEKITKPSTEIQFKSTATYECAKENQQCRKNIEQYMLTLNDSTHLCKPDNCETCEICKSRSFQHPLICAGERPYQQGDGGLLNPICTNYKVKAIPIYHQDEQNIKEKQMPIGACVTVSGKVVAQGIAQQEFNKTHWGYGYGDYVYEPTILEECILAYCKEKINETQLSDWDKDLTMKFEGDFTKQCREFIRQEFTSLWTMMVNIHLRVKNL